MNKNTIYTALHTSGKDVEDNADCIVVVYCDWVYNANWKPVELWVHNASFIVGVSGNHDNSDTRVGLRNSVVHFSAL